MRVTDAGGQSNSLDVNIGLGGFPRGTKFATRQTGDIFKEVALTGAAADGAGERDLLDRVSRWAQRKSLETIVICDKIRM